MNRQKSVQKVALCIFSVVAFALAAPGEARTRHKPAQTAAQKTEQKADDKSAASSTPTEEQPAPAPSPPPGALNVPVPPAPTLAAKSWVLMDYASGQILAGDNVDARVEPASITKVMTSYVVSAQLAAGKIKLNDEVYISENAW